VTWRPFEPSRDEMQRIEKDRNDNSCNLHRDCAAADEAVRAAGGRSARRDGWADGHFVRAGDRVFSAFHCHIDDCEDCFGC
jgi:hypothetical protein